MEACGNGGVWQWRRVAMEACVHLSKVEMKSQEQYTSHAATVINANEIVRKTYPERRRPRCRLIRGRCVRPSTSARP